jgi:hypothetical protein
MGHTEERESARPVYGGKACLWITVSTVRWPTEDLKRGSMLVATALQGEGIELTSMIEG